MVMLACSCGFVLSDHRDASIRKRFNYGFSRSVEGLNIRVWQITFWSRSSRLRDPIAPLWSMSTLLLCPLVPSLPTGKFISSLCFVLRLLTSMLCVNENLIKSLGSHKRRCSNLRQLLTFKLSLLLLHLNMDGCTGQFFFAGSDGRRTLAASGRVNFAAFAPVWRTFLALCQLRVGLNRLQCFNEIL